MSISHRSPLDFKRSTSSRNRPTKSSPILLISANLMAMLLSCMRVEKLLGSSPLMRLKISPHPVWPKVEVDGPMVVGI